jgi:5-methylcytosine-specific restriction endonuclease McrA
MARTNDEWIGKTDDTAIPPRVRLRVFDRCGGRCYICTRKIMASDYWQCDHVVALCNGGKNVESNLAPACRNCCYDKTANDLAEKSAVARKRSKYLGVKPKGRGFPKPPPGYNPWTRRIDR